MSISVNSFFSLFFFSFVVHKGDDLDEIKVEDDLTSQEKERGRSDNETTPDDGGNYEEKNTF